MRTIDVCCSRCGHVFRCVSDAPTRSDPHHAMKLGGQYCTRSDVTIPTAKWQLSRLGSLRFPVCPSSPSWLYNRLPVTKNQGSRPALLRPSIVRVGILDTVISTCRESPRVNSVQCAQALTSQTRHGRLCTVQYYASAASDSSDIEQHDTHTELSEHAVSWSVPLLPSADRRWPGALAVPSTGICILRGQDLGPSTPYSLLDKMRRQLKPANKIELGLYGSPSTDTRSVPQAAGSIIGLGQRLAPMDMYTHLRNVHHSRSMNKSQLMKH